MVEINIKPTQDYLKCEFEKIHIKGLNKSGVDIYDYLLKLRDDYKSYMKMYKVLYNKSKLKNEVLEHMELALLRYKIINENYL
jgi:hypothetical protein